MFRNQKLYETSKHQKSVVLQTKIIVMVAIAFSIGYGCKRTTHQPSVFSPSNSQQYASPIAAEPEDIEKQLTWIARSLPILIDNNTNFDIAFHNQMASKDGMLQLNEETQTLNMGLINFKNSISGIVNSTFPSNGYDSTYFFGFNFEDCLYKTHVRVSEQAVSANYGIKPTVVVTDFYNSSDERTGYYIVNGQLDSISITEESWQDYYILIVSSFSDCDNDPTSISLNPEGHCGNGICETILGETPANCVDCVGKQLQGSYTLKLMEIQCLGDNKMKNSVKPPAVLTTELHFVKYFESYFAGQYEMLYQYQILDNSTPLNWIEKDGFFIQKINKKFGRDEYETNNGHKTKKWKELLLHRFQLAKNNPELERRLISGWNPFIIDKSNGGQNNVVAINKILCLDFEPTTDVIVTNFTELDRVQSKNLFNT
jgi:hypothetical protein